MDKQDKEIVHINEDISFEIDKINNLPNTRVTIDGDYIYVGPYHYTIDGDLVLEEN